MFQIKEVTIVACSLYHDKKVFFPPPFGLGYKRALKNKLGADIVFTGRPPDSIFSLSSIFSLNHAPLLKNARTSQLSQDKAAYALVHGNTYAPVALFSLSVDNNNSMLWSCEEVEEAHVCGCGQYTLRKCMKCPKNKCLKNQLLIWYFEAPHFINTIFIIIPLNSGCCEHSFDDYRLLCENYSVLNN